MCESGAVPSGKVYRQLFDAQVQLSRSLLAGRRDTRTECLSAQDSKTHCSTASSRGQQVDDDEDDDVGDVSRLPDTVVVDCPSSEIVERLTEKKHKKHKEALKQLDTELTELTQVCETQVRTVSQELLSSLQEVDHRLDTLKDRMEQLDHVSLQEVCGLWEQVEKEVELKKTRIMELNQKLTESETQRTEQIRAVLRKHCHLLERISFLLPPDIHRLVHAEATMLNQSLLANRRSVAHLLLLLQEENLQKESLLRLRWEDYVSHWRRSRVVDIVDRFRSLYRSGADQQLISVQQMKQTQQDLTEQRRDIICRISSLVPPTCSTALVSDWFSQLTAVNQQIDSLYADFLHQLRCSYDQTWQDHLAELERCKDALSALQLSEEEVNDIVSSRLLTVIGRSQSQDKERLATLDACCDSVTRHALGLGRCVFLVMRGAALLWETHRRRVEKREEEVQRHLDDLRCSRQKLMQRKKAELNDLLGGLRQEGSEDTLKASLNKAVLYLQDFQHSCRQCVSDQWEVLDCVPPLFLEELVSYSSGLSSFYRLSHTYTLSPEELRNLHLSSTNSPNLETRCKKMTGNHPISNQKDVDPAQPPQDWLAEAASSLLDLCDINNNIQFTSAKGVAYTGPAFRCPAPELPDDLQQETHLSPFPVELLTHTLSRTRTLFLDHLEQQFRDFLSSAVTMVTGRKEAVSSEQELQLQQLNPQHIQTHIYQPRLAELQLHRQCVDAHCGDMLHVLTSCRTEMQELQTSIGRKNQQFTVALSNMEDDILMADSSKRLEAVSSTLMDCLDKHIKHTQRCQIIFRQTLQIRLGEARCRTTQLLNSFRLFSEGGDFAPQEVKMFQRRLKEETRQISATEESICSELDKFESKNLKQVKEVSSQLEEKLSSLMSEVKFMEKIQKILSSTQVHIKAETAGCNQQQSVISSRLEDVRRRMENTQVSADQVCSLLSSVSEELKRHHLYLDFELGPILQESLDLSADPKSSKQVRSAPPPGLLRLGRTGVDLLEDPIVGIVKSLNRRVQQDQQRERRQEEQLVVKNIRRVLTETCQSTRTLSGTKGQSPVQRPRQRSTESVRGGCRSIRTDRRFQIFGPNPDTVQNTHSFSSTVNSVLWKANDVLLGAAEDFYRSEHHGRFQLVPETLSQWAESMQQRLLGYQEQARRFLSTSREDLVNQLSLFEDLLHSLPSVLIGNSELQRGLELREEATGVRKRLEEKLAASEKEKMLNIRQLRASLREVELQTLVSREELRQQQLHSAICCSHLELQKCVQVRGEEFVTSLASLTEKLLYLLDNLLTPAESLVTMETGLGQKPCTGSRTWSGILYLSPPTDSTADLPSSVTTATTASITTTRCTLGHLAIIEQRDTAVQRFKQLFRLELLRSDDDKRKQLSEIQSWNTHWRQQIHSLKQQNTD